MNKNRVTSKANLFSGGIGAGIGIKGSFGASISKDIPATPNTSQEKSLPNIETPKD